MNVLWLVPAYYSFIVDELESLASHVGRLYVVSAESPPPGFTERNGNIVTIVCKKKAFPTSRTIFNAITSVAKTGGLLNTLRSWHRIRDVIGVYEATSGLLATTRIDIVHSHFAFPHGALCWISRAVPMLITLRGYDILLTGSYGALWDPFFRRSLLKAAENAPITVASTKTLEFARLIFGADADLRLVPNGIKSEHFKPTHRITRADLAIEDDDVLLVSVGGLIPRKNTDLIIRCLPALLSNHKVKLLICGSGPKLDDLTRLAERLGVSGSIRFLGHLDRTSLADIYALSDIFVHCPLCEGFGNVVLEAMVRKLLVVSTRTGVANDIITDGANGFLAEIGDLRSLQEKLAVAVGRVRDFAPAIDENAKVAGNNYGMDVRVAAYIQIYAEMPSYATAETTLGSAFINPQRK